ncbi:hypothetical protein vBVhaSVHB1_83 [Vibrio phage vB_VhaS-VHB1]|nr:hypothetical protein vBVhaSVHB1_83 [Vibrio phage vB_VhaS-VHB1]
MTALDAKIDSFKYDVVIARVMEAIDTEALEKNYDPEIVAMVAYETAYESKESDKDLDVDALTFDSFVSSVIESANLIIVHNLFD